MIKPASLRAAITAAVPDLVTNPDKLLVFADEGSVATTSTKSLSFEYRYTINLIVLDYAGDADAIMIPLLIWMKRNQPELAANLEKQRHGITFEVDHLTHGTCDISIKLHLSEKVKVSTAPDGTHTAVHQVETVPEWETLGLAG